MDCIPLKIMAHDEKDEKGDEKDEKGDEKHKEGKWQKDPLSGAIFGMILIVLGAAYFGGPYLPGPWWAWFIAGLGVVSILDAVLHSLKPEWKRPVFGKVILGIIFIVIGMGFVYEITEWWPYLLMALGAVMLIYYIRKSYSV